MNAKLAKKLRKEARKVSKEMLLPAAKELLIKASKESSFGTRFKFAWRILWGTL